MGLFDKLREPVVLKEDSSAKKQLEQLDFYSKLAPESVKEQIEQDKKLVYYGIKGEEALMFELKNSHMPMYILHDIFFEENGLTTQIDYIVITRKVSAKTSMEILLLIIREISLEPFNLENAIIKKVYIAL